MYIKDPEMVTSDDELEDYNYEFVKDFKLPFGKYKGQEMQVMILTPRKRDYLRYLLKWDELQRETRGTITCALEHYEKCYKSKPKKKRKSRFSDAK